MPESPVNSPAEPLAFLKDAAFWAEVLATGGLGALLFWALGARDLGQVAWIIGGLHVYHRYVLQHYFKTSMQPLLDQSRLATEGLNRVAGIIDLTHSTDVGYVKATIDKYFQITEPEFQKQKARILREVSSRFDRLLLEKRSETMLTAEYYDWLLPRISTTQSGDMIWAVSRMMDCEWDDSPEEMTFLAENLAAAARGVTVRRIFLCEAGVWRQAMNDVPPVRAQLECGGNLEVYFGDIATIRRRDSGILPAIGDGLIAFNSEVVLVDEHSEDGSARGFLVVDADEVAARHARFEGLRRMCALQPRLSASPPKGADQVAHSEPDAGGE